MDDLQRLRRLKEKLLAGALPAELPERIWGGPSTGMVCAACDDHIPADSLEIEAQCVDGCHRFFHGRCFSFLSLEREALAGGALGASANP
jgi:hypothetical protein